MTRDAVLELPEGGRVAWRVHGDPAGEPIVFLHGTPGSRLFVPPAATACGGRVLTLDRPGYGGSTPVAPPSLLAVARMVERILDAEGIERAAVVGFSGGGPSALACGAAIPQRVSRVAAVSAWGPLDEIEEAAASLGAEEREVLSSIRADPAAATGLLWQHAQWYVDTPLRFLEAPHDPADEAVLGDPEVHANLIASNTEGARQGQAGLVGDWVADALPWGFRLADIAVPVELWVGEQDPGRAPLDAAAIAGRIPSCAVRRDPEAGHWLVITRWRDIVA